MLKTIAIGLLASCVLFAGREATVAVRMATADGALRAYLDNYSTIQSEADVFSIDGYQALSRSDKRRVEIIAGKLVGAIDAMTDAGDARAERWRGFLKAMPGPIACWPIREYARHDATRAAIVEVERSATCPPSK